MKPYEIILQQLGGRMFIAMTGAKLMCDGDYKLIAKIKGSKKVNHIEISLNGKDLYDIRFCKIRSLDLVTDYTMNDIYCDQLVDIIEKETGLFLHF